MQCWYKQLYFSLSVETSRCQLKLLDIYVNTEIFLISIKLKSCLKQIHSCLYFISGSVGTRWSLNSEELWVWLSPLITSIIQRESCELTSCPRAEQIPCICFELMGWPCLKVVCLWYVSGIVSLSLCLSSCLYPCLDRDRDMVILEFPFTSYIEKCSQQPLYVL